MSNFDYRKYRPFPPVDITARTWPDRVITQAPQWCSVDLRDGNQALVEPMAPTQKRELFELLVAVGFKEIEVGFPAASATDFDFVRGLIEEDLIPPDVTIQILTQAREDLIDRSFEALRGARRAIVHLYNSTSRVQREQVFRLDKTGIVDIARRGAQRIKTLAARHPETEWHFQYSPESFTGTELEFAVEICDTVNSVWQPNRERPVIINLPATVEMSTPNLYADQIEWFCRHVAHREALIISVHTHNDRGCAVAAAELAVLAGADRVEGTLLGNGERTGNMDIVTMAMNLYSQGIHPQLNLADMDEIIRTVKACTQLPVHPRHPYAGELVFTAFSGSHQDAIKKCLARYQPGQPWEVAYLPIDPRDLGRSYQEVIRINSQSGKGGVAYVMQRDYGVELPRWLQIELSTLVQRQAEESKAEVTSERVWAIFERHYLKQNTPWQLHGYRVARDNGVDKLTATVHCEGTPIEVEGAGRGLAEAFVNAMQQRTGKKIVIIEYSEHAIGDSDNNTKAQAIAFVQLNIDSHRYVGVGLRGDIVEASLAAILSALNKQDTSL